ncbi:MAG: hypothetical protein WBM90_10405, partial [Acidimicrobiia bacterium]
GVARVSESFTNGALELVEESEASLAILCWTSPGFGRGNVFGSDIDTFGVRSTVPSVAVQLINPWARVVLVVGNTTVEWHREDARLAADIAKRVQDSKETTMLVLASRENDPAVAEFEEGQVEVRVGLWRAQELIALIRPDDLVVLPAYVLQDVSLTDQLRISRSFVQIDVAIVAGAHRLTVARNDAPHRMERLVGHGF